MVAVQKDCTFDPPWICKENKWIFFFTRYIGRYVFFFFFVFLHVYHIHCVVIDLGIIETYSLHTLSCTLHS